LALSSTFGAASPMFIDQPVFPGRPDALSYAVDLRGRIYYPRSLEQEQFLENPLDFIGIPRPSLVPVHPAVVVSGPPLVGKTALAKKLAEDTGAVYLSIPDILTHLCLRTTMQSALSRAARECLSSGQASHDDVIVEGLRQRLTEADVLSRGWILDDFPCTELQAKSLAEAGIVPHRILVVSMPEGMLLERARELASLNAEQQSEIVQQEPNLHQERTRTFMRQSPVVRAYYALEYDNVCVIDGTRSAWAIYDRAFNEVSTSVSQRMCYYRRTAQGMAACIRGMCFTRERIQADTSMFQRYCPVALTLGNELVKCGNTSCLVEYKSKLYWLSSKESMGHFLADPEPFVREPPPMEPPPRVLTAGERRAKPKCELEDYCAVALVDKKVLVKTRGIHIVKYQHKNWSFENREACAKFMRRPTRYTSRASLPSKKPALKGDHTVSLLTKLKHGRDGRGIESADMLTYMQASVAEVICQGLVESGERRPLCPGKSVEESALLFLARFLRARNPLNTELYAEEVRQQFEEFLSDNNVPQHVKELSHRRDTRTGVWTRSDTQRLSELCSRFDQVFGVSP